MSTSKTVKELQKYEKKRKFLSIAAYGIHYRYTQDIKKQIEQEFNERSVFLYEYFLDVPYIKGSSIEEKTGFGPFLIRLIDEQNFIPKFNRIDDNNDYSKIVFNPSNFENLYEFWEYGKNIKDVGCTGAIIEDIEEYTTIGKEIFKKWKNNNYSPKTKSTKYLKREENLIYGNYKYGIEYLKNKYLSELHKIKVKSKISFIGSMKEYLTVVYPLLSLNIESINVSAISLSTEKVFYGMILIFYPESNNILKDKGIFQNPKSAGVSKTIIELTKIVHNLYIPVLAYFENYWAENTLNYYINKVKDDKEITDDKKPLALYALLNNDKTIIYLNKKLQKSNDSIEKSFYSLWKERKDFINNNLSTVRTLKRIEDNLIFAKYLIASPGMVDTLNEIVTYRKSKQNGRQYCPSFLVIGDAGSGKDKISKLIQLFFPEYRFGERVTINMASLKPTYLAVPLMSGGEIDYNLSNPIPGVKKIELDGIFTKIWKKFSELENYFKKERNFTDVDSRKFMKENGLMPVIILDELNSLDIDAQGALLRILENKSLQALGSINELEIDFLIVGVVNEAEESLTLEKPLKKIMTDNVIFGGILGKVVYEHVRNLRRLREDLYYRLIREGKIEIPALSERREDIPMLFYFFLKEELEDKEEDLLWIDLSFFNELMSDRFNWSGNFRELQSLTKRIVRFARYDCIPSKGDNHFRITVQHLEKARSNSLESI